MSFFLIALQEAWKLLITGDPFVLNVTGTTLEVAALATAIALILGLPAGLALGLSRQRRGRPGLLFANAGLGLPPVVVGIVCLLLFVPLGPLGALHFAFNLKGVIAAQAILALPIVVAFTASAVRAIPTSLIDQARAFGASRSQVALLALREARFGVIAAAIAAVGSALSEVGAVILVGGNIQGEDQTLASAALFLINSGAYADGLAVGIVLLILILIIAAALTFLQYHEGKTRRVSRS
jgi:tungstate transport system permease protein